MTQEISNALNQMILSASGWRKIFTEDQEEESLSPNISSVDGWLAYVAGFTFASYLKTEGRVFSKKILLARDTRPTGGALVSHVVLGVQQAGLEYFYIGITSITELLAYVRESGLYDGFFYITASHNPVGHNGFKFGLTNGSVLGGSSSAKVIALYKLLLTEQFSAVECLSVKPILSDSRLKLQASKAYKYSIEKSLLSLTADHMLELKKFITLSGGLGIVIDFNGSSRISSIDQSLLSELGVKVHVMGGQLSHFKHAIVPEGESLTSCMRELEKMHQVDKAYQLGIGVDCDGDRGNLVYINDTGKSEIIDAQNTFMLSVLAMLTYEKSKHNSSLSVVVNDATSLCIEKICKIFHARCHWTETGEANVLTKANRLRMSHHYIPICGEGSNGGTIIHPSTVRDPLTTLVALLNFLFMRYKNQNLLEIFQRKIGVSIEPWSVAKLMMHLPRGSTTSVVSPEALLRIKSSSYQLKKTYLDLFNKKWLQWKQDYKEDKLSRYEIYYYEGIDVYQSLQKPANGGMRIHIFNMENEIILALWLRVSKTEPVLRLMVDSCVKQHRVLEHRWLKIHRELIIQADALASS